MFAPGLGPHHKIGFGHIHWKLDPNYRVYILACHTNQIPQSMFNVISQLAYFWRQCLYYW